jgi:hypothetical protein
LIGGMRYQAVVRRKLERLGLALGAPAQLRSQLEILAQEQRGQKESELQAVFLRRREQAERAVEVQMVGVWPGGTP